jgi:hypothetical protein
MVTLDTLHRTDEMKRSNREKLKEARAKVEQLEASLKEADNLAKSNKELSAEVVRLTSVKTKLEAEVKAAEEMLPGKLKEADQAGWDRCRADIVKQLPDLLSYHRGKGIRKGIRSTHSSSFLLGYEAGLKAAEVAADSSLHGSAVVPEIILPEVLQALSDSEDEEEPKEGEEEEEEEEEEADPPSSPKPTSENITSADPSAAEKPEEGVLQQEKAEDMIL